MQILGRLAKFQHQSDLRLGVDNDRQDYDGRGTYTVTIKVSDIFGDDRVTYMPSNCRKL
jgi:hypothetical protein